MCVTLAINLNTDVVTQIRWHVDEDKCRYLAAQKGWDVSLIWPHSISWPPTSETMTYPVFGPQYYFRLPGGRPKDTYGNGPSLSPPPPIPSSYLSAWNWLQVVVLTGAGVSQEHHKCDVMGWKGLTTKLMSQFATGTWRHISGTSFLPLKSDTPPPPPPPPYFDFALQAQGPSLSLSQAFPIHGFVSWHEHQSITRY